MLLFKILAFFVFAFAVDCAKILGIFHMPTYSHYQLGYKLLSELAIRGHEVTSISPYPQKELPKNFNEVILTGVQEKFQTVKEKLFELTKGSTIDHVLWLESLGYTKTEETLSHPNVQTLLKSNQTFDVVIIDQIITDAFKGFCHHYSAICIVLSPMHVPHWTHPQLGNPDSPAYIPDMYSPLEFDSSFKQRFLNTLIYVGLRLFYHFYALPRQDQLLQKYFPNSPPLTDLYYNTSLVLINSHVSITNSAKPYLPNMIEIGGYHVSPPKKLPKEFQEYLDSAKNGVVLFSLGSALESKDMPIEKSREILKAFSKLKQKVLWKWEVETMADLPSNVKLSKWLPQADILAHPNIKLLISHGGFLSTTEAVYRGVPIIGIPIFSDQWRNIAIAEKAGFALFVPYSSLNEKALSYALHEMLNNSTYVENVKRRSKIMHDEPLSQLDKAIFWIEYVIRHKGAPHLRSAALALKWYQYLLLDVIAVVALISFLSLFLIYKIFKKCLLTIKQPFDLISKEKKA